MATKEQAAAYYKKNRKRILARQAKWQRANPAKCRARSLRWSQQNKDRVRAIHILSAYGLTQEQHTRLLKKQGHVCAICKEEFAGSPHVDHDHATGEVRGLLCNACNVGLGRFRDSLVLIKAAAEYLRIPPCTRSKR